ncbi:hypothetical protein [Candidatus Avelusimicrobium alvi]|uniref:hypothetical protein n=1 Tax=Candidatus Avelusimicrobium alvi TaxID=3416221 RepID=UPI003D1267A9
MNVKEQIQTLRARYISRTMLQNFVNRQQDYTHLPEQSIQTIICGASKARYDVYPNTLEMFTFNAGEVSADLYTTFFLVKSLLYRCPNVQNIILFYSFYNIGYDLSKSNFKALCPLFSSYLNVPLPPISKTLKWGVYLKILRSNVKPNRQASPTGDDFPGIFTKQDIDALAHKHYKQATKYGQNQWSWFIKLHELCALLQKRLIVVFPPERTDYRQSLSKLQNKENIYAPFHTLKQLVIDTREWMEDNYFGDESHLSREGAKIYTDKLNKALKPYITKP